MPLPDKGNIKPRYRFTPEMKWLVALFLVTGLGGAIRKWFINSAGLSNLILGIQMVIPFLMFYFRSKKAISPFRKFGILYVYFFYLVFHIFYPLQLTFFHGLFGMLVHGGFWLGIFFYFANRDLFDTSKLMKPFLAIAALEIVLAFIQYSLPQSHFLNKYAREGITIAVVGDRVRVTGTFSYLSGYTAFTMFYALLMWAMIRLKYPQWLVILAMTFGVAASFMTGSRSAVVINLLLVVPMLLKEYPVQSLFKLAGRLTIPAMILLAVLQVNKTIDIRPQIGKAYDNFMERVETNRRSGEQSKRFTMDLEYIQHANWQHPILGVGLGSTYQGAVILFGTSRYVREFGYVESEFTRVLLEGGWVIVILKFVIGIMMALNLSFKGVIRWAVWFVVAVGQPIVFNPHNAAFLLMGIILVDNIIWRQQQEKNRLARESRAAAAPANQLAPESLSPLAAVNNDRHFNGHPERSEGSHE